MHGNSRGRLQAAAARSAIPVRNERGIIAESYSDLQALGVLKRAREKYPLPKASAESTVRAVFQSVEIVLLNLADIMNRARSDLERGMASSATVKMFWARAFHRLLTRLSLMPHQLAFFVEGSGNRNILSIGESPAFREYFEALKAFDRVVVQLYETGGMQIDVALSDQSLDSANFNLIHCTRISNHEATVWERNLLHVAVPAAIPSYESFVVSDMMREAVYERVLTGDTYFTQFRGLHQVPEILGEELNDRLERAIRDIRNSRMEQAIDQLSCIDVLSEGILASLPPMVDNLATSDYHAIRENLGLTSGSHSVCLRFDMFTHLYEQFSETVRRHSVSSPEISTWAQHRITNYCSKFRTFIFQWRDEHLNLPRNNLGGEFTKSLTGSPDAIQAVKQMRDSARMRDPMQPLLRVGGISTDESMRGAMAAYLESEGSLDACIASVTGSVTQRRFHNVQERLGYFANKCPFTPPPRREA